MINMEHKADVEVKTTSTKGCLSASIIGGGGCLAMTVILVIVIALLVKLFIWVV